MVFLFISRHRSCQKLREEIIIMHINATHLPNNFIFLAWVQRKRPISDAWRILLPLKVEIFANIFYFLPTIEEERETWNNEGIVAKCRVSLLNAGYPCWVQDIVSSSSKSQLNALVTCLINIIATAATWVEVIKTMESCHLSAEI